MDNYELDLKVGDYWFVKVHDSKYGFEAKILQVGSKTIVLKSTSSTVRFEISDVNFIEKLNERDVWTLK